MKISHKLISLTFFAILAAAPLSMSAAELYAETPDIQDIAFSLTNKDLRVQNAESQILKIYNVTGICVATYRIDSNDKTFSLTLPKACYILKVGKVARKISLH